jgi:ribosomal protein S18 acetylase RimI-like enzyme
VTITIDVFTEATGASIEDVSRALSRLIPQLSRSAPPLDADALRRVVACDSNTLLLARDDDTIVGTLTLMIFPLPTGLRARIEDVVVDEAGRGKGVGAALTEEAMRRARLAGARTVELASRRSRVAAHRLYHRLGFAEHDSTVFRLELAD